MGMNEIVSYSFINPKDLSLLRMPSDKYIKLENPIDKNVNIMRTTLTAGIINNILYNIHRGNDAVHIFEIGRCFFPQENKLVPPAAGTTSSLGISKFLDYQIMPKEDLYLAIGICGNPGEAHWRKTQPVIDFFYLKGIIEEVMRKLFIKDYQFQKKDSDTFCPGKSCNITIGNKEIGKFGELHPQVVINFDIKAKNIYIAELNISLLLEMTKDIQRDKFEPLPKFPQIRRDISIILDKQTQSYDIIEAAVGIGLDIIEDIKIFDVYEGHPIPEGKKSIAYAVFYRSKDRTLTDEEVDNTHNVLRCKLLETIKGEIRE
jgi:phenylalanyl-tRNA synthetase beta chain